MTTEECYHTCPEAYYAVNFIARRDGTDRAEIICGDSFEESVPLIERMNGITEEIYRDALDHFPDRSPEGLIIIPADGMPRPWEPRPEIATLIEERKGLVVEFVEKMGLPSDMLEKPYSATTA